MAKSRIARTCPHCGYQRMAAPLERRCPLCGSAYASSTRYRGDAAAPWHDAHWVRMLLLSGIIGTALATELKLLLFPDLSWRAYALIVLSIQVVGFALPQDAKRARRAEIRTGKSRAANLGSKATFGR